MLFFQTLFPFIIIIIFFLGANGEIYYPRVKTTPQAVALDNFNKELLQYRHHGAELAWEISTNMSQNILDENIEFTIERNSWNNEWCSKLMEIYYSSQFTLFSPSPLPPYPHNEPWTLSQHRQLYLICRGPRFSSYQLSSLNSVQSMMQKIYGSEITMEDGQRLRMEPDLNRIMESSRDESYLKKIWMKWHSIAGSQIKPYYLSLVQLLNQGARQAGHKDMGEIWREETEVPELKRVALSLYDDVKYLYQLLHAFVRHKLESFYKIKFNGGIIPVHLLGNMYAQNWESLIDIVWEGDDEDQEENPIIQKLLPNNASVLNMVKAAEEFFVSMGLPRLPSTFWKNSYFQEDKNSLKNCHGSAANMFGTANGGSPDYRMMMCAQVKDQDMITFQHEIGHIVYFMAYSNLPAIFQDGANSAFHESVGDSVTYDLLPMKGMGKADGFKLGIDMKTLLKMGLMKLPQIGYGLIMDLWRWGLFESENENSSVWNKNWWKLHEEYLGVSKPLDYDPKNEYLDATGKFHIIDNIPYIRYFLGSFLQIQFYDAMCSAAVGRKWDGDMHKCQIKGSKDAGRLLHRMLSRGTSQHWSDTLKEMTGSSEISSEPLLRYFHPLKIWLEGQITKKNLTIGWNLQ